MQTTGDRADFPFGTAVSGSSTADSSGINGPFTACDALMRERDALVYHRQMLERKKAELEQSLQKQRSENEVYPALFIFPSAKALLIATSFDRVCPTFITHGVALQCVHNSAVLSSWFTPIGSRVGATGLTEYQKSFHAQYLMRTLRHVKEISLCSVNQVGATRALTTVHTAPMLRRLELDVPKLSEPMVQCISQMETAGRLECVSIRLHHITPALKLLCSLLSLCSLDVSHTTISNEDLSGLRGCHSLVEMDLSYCRGVTDLSHISQIKTLEVFKLTRSNVLFSVGSVGRLPRLKELYLSETLVTDDDVLLLSKSHTLVKIDLHSCQALANVNPLSSIATLEVIKLSNCTALTHVGALGKLPALKDVCLSGTPITDEDVRQLSKSHTLVKIDLHSCQALANVNPLSSIATLEVIKLSNCTALTHVGALGKLPALKDVCLSGTPITDEEIRLLSESHTLAKVHLQSCQALTNVNPLSSIATLEVIKLSNCTALTHVGALGKLPVLKEVDLRRTRIKKSETNSLTSLRQQLGLPSVYIRIFS